VTGKFRLVKEENQGGMKRPLTGNHQPGYFETISSIRSDRSQKHL
jgi:hypothetical protein